MANLLQSQLPWAGAMAAVLLAAPAASAHHEALFGPQSSLAVEARAFLSLQTHVHAYGVNGTGTEETTTILSGGGAPFASVPLSFSLVQPFTYQTSRAPTPDGVTGPFSSCDGCLRRENALVAAQYRFDFTELQRAFGKDGNFALLSLALEPPTGNKDYPAFKGPFNGIAAGMVGFERGAWSAVAIAYYRLNTLDSTSSKKGDNYLVGLGAAYTPIDEADAMLSFQLGLGAEVHLRDVDRGATVAASGGWETLVSPTVVFSPASMFRVFALASLPFAQSYRDDGQRDRWRLGAGVLAVFP